MCPKHTQEVLFSKLNTLLDPSCAHTFDEAVTEFGFELWQSFHDNFHAIPMSWVSWVSSEQSNGWRDSGHWLGLCFRKIGQNMTFTASVCVCSFVKICRHLGFMCEMQPLVWTHSLQACCCVSMAIANITTTQSRVFCLKFAGNQPSCSSNHAMHFLLALITIHSPSIEREEL